MTPKELTVKWEVDAEIPDGGDQSICITADGIGYVCGIHCSEDAEITPEDVAILEYIANLHNERLTFRTALQNMLDAYAPGVNWSKPERLHSAVRSAGELLGHCKKGGNS
jgi:hypothetical protein